MGTKFGPAERARRQMSDDDRRVRAEIGLARRGAGLSLDAVGAACRVSGSSARRIEQGITRTVDVRTLACLGAAVGLEVRLRAFVAGDPIRDVGQQRLLERLRLRLDRGLRWATEVPLPIEGDRRAWDAVIDGKGWRLGVEAETVLDDVQAVERRLALKQRDGGMARVILLVAATRRNRRALAATPGAFSLFARDPAGVRATLRALGEGRDPGVSSILVL